MSITKLHDDELDIDVPLVRRLLRTHCPQWAELPLEPAGGAGTDNVLVRLGDDLVVRLPRRGATLASMESELRWPTLLAPHLPVAVPTVLAVVPPGDDHPSAWTVQRWLVGETPSAERPLADPLVLAGDLAAFVTALRGVDLAGGSRAYRAGPLSDADDSTRAAIARLDGEIDTAAALALWEECLAAPEWEGPEVWVHADLMPANLLVRGGRLSAVIDFATVGVGDPASDLRPAWNLLPAGEAREAFRDAVGIDDATWVRGMGWAFSQALQALPYYRESNPVMVGMARYVIGEVLGVT